MSVCAICDDGLAADCPRWHAMFLDDDEQSLNLLQRLDLICCDGSERSYSKLEQIVKSLKRQSAESLRATDKIIDCFRKMPLHGDEDCFRQMRSLADIAGFSLHAPKELRAQALEELILIWRCIPSRLLTDSFSTEMCELLHNLKVEHADEQQVRKFDFVKLLIDRLAITGEMNDDSEREAWIKLFKGVRSSLVEAAAVASNINEELKLQSIASLVALERQFIVATRGTQPSNLPPTIDQIWYKFVRFQRTDLPQWDRIVGPVNCIRTLTQIVDSFCQFPDALPNLQAHALELKSNLESIFWNYTNQVSPLADKISCKMVSCKIVQLGTVTT